MKRILLDLRGALLVLFVALCAGGGVVMSVVNSTEVRAEACTKSGEMKNINGVLTCDCTIETVNTCACVIPCPPKND